MKKYFSIFLLCAVAVTASAVPARRGPILRTTEDGSLKTVYLHGDAFSHHMTDLDGVWLDERTLQPMSEEAKAARIEVNSTRAQARRIQQANKTGKAPNLAPRGLLILVNFKNKEFVTPYDTILNMLDGDNFTRKYEYDYEYQEREGGPVKTEHVSVTSSGSARKYFFDQSYGYYNPTFDVVGPYTLSKDYSYYGKNDDANVGLMIKEACQLADEAGADFTLYDNDKDGKVDFVYVLYAGYGEADGGPENTVWPHNYELSLLGVNCTVDGKKVNNYACSNEISYASDMYNGIGTFCHEFSHVLGLPDLYETNTNPKGLHTLFEWDILDYGPYNNDGNTPPAYSAYERFYCGWLKPRVLKDPESIFLSHINFKKGDAILLCEGDQHNMVGYDPDPQVFYLLEARHKTGWDEYLPGRGMLITKISYSAKNWEYNRVNNSADNMGVDLIEAKKNTMDYAYYTDAFPYGAKSWTGFANHEVTEISMEAGGSIAFSYRGAEKSPIENVEGEEKPYTKILQNGQVVIIRNGKTYDLTGREL